MGREIQNFGGAQVQVVRQEFGFFLSLHANLVIDYFRLAATQTAIAWFRIGPFILL